MPPKKEVGWVAIRIPIKKAKGITGSKDKSKERARQAQVRLRSKPPAGQRIGYKLSGKKAPQ